MSNNTHIKGAQSTTAIGGNTLSEEEIKLIDRGKKLSPSKEYQQKEVKNIINALNSLLLEVVKKNKGDLINKKILLKFHKMIGNNLGDKFEAIPGKFRNNNVFVGKYRPPDNKYVPEMIDEFCAWMPRQFNYKKNQNFMESVIQAIISHVYIAWIHPFGDGNGRTARLLEFYILLRAGNPDFASHLLSNFYNKIRPEYYYHLNNSTITGELTAFIKYAIQGYRDGLLEILKTVNKSQIEISWGNYIYSTFSGKKASGKTELLKKRPRKLILSIPLDSMLSIEEMIKTNIDIALLYSKLSSRTIDRDIKELLKLELLVETNEKKYKPNIEILKKFISKKIVK